MTQDTITVLCMLTPFALIVLLFLPFKFRIGVVALHGFCMLPLGAYSGYLIDDVYIEFGAMVVLTPFFYIIGCIFAAIAVRTDFSSRDYKHRFTGSLVVLAIISAVAASVVAAANPLYFRAVQSLEHSSFKTFVILLSALPCISIGVAIRQKKMKRPVTGLALFYGTVAAAYYAHAVLTLYTVKTDYSVLESIFNVVVGLVGAIMMRAGGGGAPSYYYILADSGIPCFWHAGMVLCFLAFSRLGLRLLKTPSAAVQLASQEHAPRNAGKNAES